MAVRMAITMGKQQRQAVRDPMKPNCNIEFYRRTNIAILLFLFRFSHERRPNGGYVN